jgi:hypothetical protein
VFCPPSSECTKSTATNTGQVKDTESAGAKLDQRGRGETGKQNSTKEDRWWLHDPLATGAGG